MDLEIMTLREVSAFTKVPLETLRWYRARSGGPRTFKLAGRVVARREDVEAWIAASAENDAAYARTPA